MNAIEVLREVSASSSGRTPSFTKAHALKALELIGSARGIGRQQLSRELGLGEGTARTLVARMKGQGLLDTSRGGMTLTLEGRELLKAFHELLLTAEFPETQMTVGPNNYAVLVRGAGESVRKGVEQRDAAMIAGAEGATTLVHDGGGLRMPGVEMDVDPSTKELVYQHLRPCKGDAIIIGSADDPLDAEIGAKSAALKLLERSPR